MLLSNVSNSVGQGPKQLNWTWFFSRVTLRFAFSDLSLLTLSLLDSKKQLKSNGQPTQPKHLGSLLGCGQHPGPAGQHLRLTWRLVTLGHVRYL